MIIISGAKVPGQSLNFLSAIVAVLRLSPDPGKALRLRDIAARSVRGTIGRIGTRGVASSTCTGVTNDWLIGASRPKTEVKKETDTGKGSKEPPGRASPPPPSPLCVWILRG